MTVHTTNTGSQTGFGLLEIPDPPPLPGSSMIDRFLFESPGAVIACIFVGCIVTWLRLRHSQRPKFVNGILIAGVLLSISLGLLARIVHTSAEVLRETSVNLVSDAIRGRSDLVRLALHEDCVLVESSSRDEMDRDRILRGVRERLPTLGIVDHAVLKANAHCPNDRYGKVQLKVRVNIRGAGVHFSWWELEYEHTSGGRWLVLRIKPLSMTGRDAL